MQTFPTKRLVCSICLFVTAWSFYSVVWKERWQTVWEAAFTLQIGKIGWSQIALILSALIIGWFVLPKFISDNENQSKIGKPVLGFMISTYLCAVSFQFGSAFHQIFISSYDVKYGVSYVGDLTIALILAPVGIVFSIPFWLIGALCTQFLWLYISKSSCN